MKKIFVQYGNSILELLLIIGLTTFVFTNMTDTNGNKGLYNILSSYAEPQVINYETYQDKTAAVAFSEIEEPIITLNTNKQYKINTTYKLSDYIQATDANNLSVKIIVKNITYQDESDCMDIYSKETGDITFSKVGVYTLKIKTIDSNNFIFNTKINININR